MTTPIIMLILMTLPAFYARLLRAAGGPVIDICSAAAVGLGLLFVHAAKLANVPLLVKFRAGLVKYPG